MVFVPCLARLEGGAPGLGEPLLDEYLRFVAARARPNTVLAQTFDLKVFFTVVGVGPLAVTTTEVLRFIEVQRRPRQGNVVRLVDGEAGMAASTIKRRLATVSSLFEYLAARGVVARNPVPRSLSARPGRAPLRGSPLVRAPRRLPRILGPDEVDRLVGALRTDRDRAMVWLMLLGGLRRCEVLGLRMADLRPGERRVFVADDKGGHQRLVPVAGLFFAALVGYFDGERRPAPGVEHVFVVLKGPRRAGRCRRPGSMRCWLVPGVGRGWSTPPATSCGIPVSPGCGNRVWRWRRSRPRPGTLRSSQPGSTCTWRRTGWSMSTARPWTFSTA